MSSTFLRSCHRSKHLSTAIISPLRHNSSTGKADSSFVSVVSTAQKGIGLEFAQQILNAEMGGRVICLCRGKPSKELLALQAAYSTRVHIVDGVDLESVESITRTSQEISTHTNKIDLLLNVAAILGDGSKGQGPERAIASIDPDWLHKTINTNLVGHILMTQALFPLLQTAGKQRKAEKEKEFFCEPCVVNISARVGSIGDNQLGGWYSYRISKAALNMFTKTFSLEAKRSGVNCISVHPGTVNTGLSKPFHGNVRKDKLFTPEFSVSSMLKVIRGVGVEHSGQFFAYDGSTVPY